MVRKQRMIPVVMVALVAFLVGGLVAIAYADPHILIKAESPVD